MFKTTEYEHWFIYLQKTEALICHCGWGTINAYRMMQHLRHIHSERVSQPQILARFYYHKIPEFRKVQVCERTFDGQRCEFRTPFIQIMAKHRCDRDNKRFQNEHCFSVCSKSETGQNKVYRRDTSQKLRQHSDQNGGRKQTKYRPAGERNRGSKKKPGDHCHTSVNTLATEVTESGQNSEVTR